MFYALKIGQREISWRGQKVMVHVFDHGKPLDNNPTNGVTTKTTKTTEAKKTKTVEKPKPKTD